MPLQDTLAELDEAIAEAEKPSVELDRLLQLADEDPEAFRRAQIKSQLQKQFEEVPNEESLDKIVTSLRLSRGLAKGGLKKTGAGLLRTIGARRAADTLSQSGEADVREAQEATDLLGGGGLVKTASMLGSTAAQTLPLLPLGAIGLPALAIGAGVQSFGSIEDEAFNAYQRASDKNAYLKSLPPAIAGGLITGLLTRFMPGGVERSIMQLLQGGGKQAAVRQGVTQILKQAVAKIPKEAIEEFPEEALDQLSQGLIAKFSYAPEKTTPDILRESLIAGLAGSFLGGALGGVHLVAKAPAIAGAAKTGLARAAELQRLEAQRGTPERLQDIESVYQQRQQRRAAEPIVESIMAAGKAPMPTVAPPPIQTGGDLSEVQKGPQEEVPVTPAIVPTTPVTTPPEVVPPVAPTPPPNAQTIRTDTGLVPAPGQVPEGSQAPRRDDIQQVAPAPPQPVAPREPPKNYQEAQARIDELETQLEQSGVDVTKLTNPRYPNTTSLLGPPEYQPMPQELSDLYHQRDQFYLADRRVTDADLRAALKNSGVPDEKAGEILKLLNWDSQEHVESVFQNTGATDAPSREQWRASLTTYAPLGNNSFSTFYNSFAPELNQGLFFLTGPADNLQFGFDPIEPGARVDRVAVQKAVAAYNSVLAALGLGGQINPEAFTDAAPPPPSRNQLPGEDKIASALQRIAPYLQRMGVSVREVTDPREASELGLDRGAGLAADVFNYNRNELIFHRPTLRFNAQAAPASVNIDQYFKSLVDHEYVHFAQREVLREQFDQTGRPPEEFTDFVQDHYQAIFSEMTPEQVAEVIHSYLGQDGTPADMPNGEWGTAFEFVRQIVQGERTGTTDELVGRGGARFIAFLKAILEKIRNMIAGATPDLQPLLTNAAQSVQSYLDKIEQPAPTANSGLFIAQTVRDELLSGQTLTARDIPQTGLDRKQAEEWAELGVVQAAREIVQRGRNRGASNEEIFDELLNLYNRQPTFGTRTSTSRVDQAFSTPVPIAWLVDVLGDVEFAKKLYEPTAGHGALLIGRVASTHVMGNELNPDRLDRLRQSGLVDEFTGDDAATENPVDVPTHVVANPPFGTVLDHGVRKVWNLEGLPPGSAVESTNIDHVIVMRALNAMAKDGRAVLILGGPKDTNATFFYRRDFYHFLYELYNVVDHFTVDGDLYRKQGSAWPIDIIVIKGKGKSALPLPATSLPPLLRTWDEIRSKITSAPGQTQTTEPGGTGGVTGPEGGPSVGGPGLPGPDVGGPPAGDRRRPAALPRKTGGRPTAPGPNAPISGEPGVPGGPGGVAGGGPETTGGGGAGPPGGLPGPVRGLSPEKAAKLAEFQARNKERIDRLRNSLGGPPRPAPAGGITPQQQLEFIQFAEELLREGFNSFPDFVEALVATFGDIVVPYTKALYEWHRNTPNLTTSPAAEVDTYLSNRPALEVTPATPPTPVTIEEIQVDYVPVSKLSSGGFKVPRNLASHIRNSLETIEREIGMSVDEFVSDRLQYPKGADLSQYFFAEQVEAIASTIYSIENGGAVINGFGTGSGKGRIAAAIIRYSTLTGRTPVFVSAVNGLYNDMLGDLSDIDSPNIIPFMTNNDLSFIDKAGRRWRNGDNNPDLEEIAASGQLPGGAQAVFTTYSQISSDVPKGFTEKKKDKAKRKKTLQARPDGNRMRALRAVAPNAIFILDESHLAAGVDSDTTIRLRQLLNAAQGAYYSSATFAKYPESMGIYFKTKVSETGLSPTQLVEVMKKGGLPLQQVLTSMLAQEGQYTRVENTFEGIDFTPIVAQETSERDGILSDEYMDVVSQLARLSGLVMTWVANNQPGSGDITGIDQGSITGYGFANQMFLIARQFLLALKAESAINLAVQEHAAGRKPVFMLEQTMEGPLSEIAAAKYPLNFRGMLLRYLEKIVTVQERAAGQTEKTEKRIYDELPPEFQAMFDEIRDQIMQAEIEALPLSPVDYIIQGLKKRGITVGELTGRTTGIDYDTGKLYNRPNRDTTTNGKIKTMAAFNANEVDGIIYNAAGSTGFSLQAARKFLRSGGDTKPRTGIILQAALDINTFMQQIGRINRKGQDEDKLPRYLYLQTDLPAERRPAAVLTRRMAGLNANTTSNTQTDLSGLSNTPDIFNKYGDEAVHRAFQEHPQVADLMFKDGMTTVDEMFENSGEQGAFSRKVTGHMVQLPKVDQTKVWDAIIDHYNTIIDALNETGENDLEAKAYDYAAQSVDKQVIYDGEGTSVFSGPAFVERMKIKAQKKPLPLAEIYPIADEYRQESLESGRAFLDGVVKREAEFLATAKARNPDFDETHAKARYQQIRNDVRAAMDMVGKRVQYKTKSGDTQYGVVTRLEFDQTKPDRLASQKITVYLNISNQRIRLPLSQLSEVQVSTEPEESFNQLYDATAESVDEKTIVTGNILGGFQALRDLGEEGGKVVNYTTADGQVQTGIQLSAAFTAGSVVPVNTLDDLKLSLFLERRVRSPEGVLFEVFERRELHLVVPASKAKGGKFWREKDLTDLLAGGEFKQSGSSMRGVIPEANLGAIFTLLTTRLGQRFAYIKTAKDKAKPAPAAAIHPGQVRRTVELEAARGNVPGAEAELLSASAQNKSVIEIFDTVGAAIGADQETKNRLGMSRASRVMSEATRLHGVVVGGVFTAPDYAAIQGSSLPQALKNMATKDMLTVLRNYEVKFERTRRAMRDQQQKVNSGTFLSKVRKRNNVEARANALERMVTSFQAQMSAGMAKAKLVMDASNSSAEAIARATAEYNFYQKLLQYPEAIRQRAQDMVDMLWGDAQGQQLLAGTGYLPTGLDFLTRYNELKDAKIAANPNITSMAGWIPHRGEVEQALTSAVADVLARSEEVRRDLMAAYFPPALMGPLSQLEEQLFNEIKADPQKAFKSILKRAVDLSTRQGQLYQLWLALNKEVEHQIELLNSLTKQVALADAVESSVPWRVLRNTVNSDAGRVVTRPATLEFEPSLELHRPTLDELSYKEWIPMPDGGLPLDISLTTKDLPRVMPEMFNGLRRLEAWLTDPANLEQKDAQGNVIPNSRNPYYEFWEMTYNRLDGIYTTSLGIGNFINARDRNIWSGGLLSGRHGPWGMLEFMLKAAQIPAGRIAAIAVHNWKAAFEQSSAWIRVAVANINQALINASRAHDYHKGNVAGDDVTQWYKEVGNEFFFSAQEMGRTKAVGELLGSGRRVKREDLQALRVMHEEVERLIQLNMRIGREKVMQESLIAEKQGVWRKAIELGDQMLPRIFDGKWQTLVGEFHEIGMTGRKDKSQPVRKWLAIPAPARTRIFELLNGDFAQDLIYGFVSDRHPDFARPAPWEAAYTEAAEAIRNDREQMRTNPGSVPVGPRTMQELFSFIAARTPSGTTLADIEEGVMDEVVRQFENVYKNVFEGSTVAAVGQQTQRNAFTSPRESRVANFFFYKHGFGNTPSVVGFGMDAASYWYERLLWALQGRGPNAGALQGGLINALHEELKAKENIKNRLMLGNLTLTEATHKANQAKIEFEDYERLVHQITTFVQNMEKEYSSGGRVEREEFSTLQRLFSDSVGLALATVNAIGNITGSTRFLGEALRIQTNSWILGHFSAWGSTIWELIATGVPALAKVAGYGARNIINVPLSQAGFRIGGKLTAPKIEQVQPLEGLRPRVAQAFRELFEDLGDAIWEHSKFYQDMVRLGYHSPEPLALTVSNRIMLGATGGKIYDMRGLARGPFKPLTDFIWGAVVNGLEIPVDALRAFFPRGFDMVANTMAMRNAATAINIFTAQLRRTFNESPPGRFDLANPKNNTILPSDVVPPGVLRVFDKLVPGSTNNTKEIIEWFTNAGLPFTETIIDFFRRLSAVPKSEQGKVQLVTPDQMLQLGAIVVEDVNKATPLNRPIQTKTSPVLRTLTTFYGYWAHRYRKQLSIHGPALEDPKVHRLWLKAMSMLGFGASVFVLGGLGYGYLDELMRRWLYRLVYGEERAFRLPHEATTEFGRNQSAAAMMVSGVPLVGTFAAQFIANQPGRAVGVTAFAQNRINDLGSYVVGVAKTGDPSYRLPQLLSGILPLGKMVLNQMPGYEGVIEARNATRLLQREGEEDLIRRPGSGYGAGNVTPLTPYGDKILNSIMRGDAAGAQALFDEAVQVATKLGVSNPERSVRQAIESRNPINRAFRVKPSEDQLEQVFSRLAPNESTYLRGLLERYQTGARALGVSANLTSDEAGAIRGGFGGGGGGGFSLAAAPRAEAPSFRSRRRRSGLRLRGGLGRVARTRSFRPRRIRLRLGRSRRPRLRSSGRSRLRLRRVGV